MSVAGTIGPVLSACSGGYARGAMKVILALTSNYSSSSNPSASNSGELLGAAARTSSVDETILGPIDGSRVYARGPSRSVFSTGTIKPWLFTVSPSLDASV